MNKKTKIIIFGAVAAFSFVLAGKSFGANFSWADLSGNNAKKGLISERKGAETSVAVSESGQVYVAFQDKRERVFVREFDGTNWSNLPAGLNADYVARNGDKPALAVKGNDLYLAYKDLDAGRRAKVKKWDGSTWSDVVDPDHAQGYISDRGGFEPVLCLDRSGENLYAAFRDEAGGEKIKVMKWSDLSGWSDVADADHPGGLISSAVASEVDLKASKINQDIFAAFEDRGNGNKIRVKKWNGAAWQNLSDENHPEGIVSPIAGYSPSIDTDNSGNLYLVYTGYNAKNTYVQKWSAGRWEDLGGGVAVQGRTIESAISVDGRDNLYLAYSQKTKGAWKVRVKIWNGSQWFDAKVGKNKNISKGRGKGDPSLTTFENKLYMSFTDARNKNRAKVKMLNFE